MLESINVTYENKVVMGRGFNVELGQEPVPINHDPDDLSYESNMKGEHLSSYRNSEDLSYGYNKSLQSFCDINELFTDKSSFIATYNSTEPFPGKLYTKIGIQRFRGYSILIVNLHPVQYIPSTGEIYYYERMTLTVKTQEKDQISPLFRGLQQDESRVREMVDNPSMASSYESRNINPTMSLGVDPSQSYDYVVITTESLNNSPGPYTFQDLINLKIAKGLNATIVTVEDIINNPAYWNTTNPLFNDTQAKIRNFIRDAYLNWGTEYVLLGGDSDDNKYYEDYIIPTRKLTAHGHLGVGLYGNVRFSSDVYYCCLDGNYNSDRDGAWGEPTDGINGSDVDLVAEVYVGRAPVDSFGEVSNFVKKTIMYEYTYDSYLKKALMVGEYLGPGIDVWGGDYKDEIINGSSAEGYNTTGIPTDIYNISTLYERDWPSWPKSELIGRMENGTHIINHLGHANSGSVMKLVRSDVDSLTNDKFFFIYSQGCQAGRFDVDDCIAEHFTNTPHGAFAVVMNSWYGYVGESNHYDREFFDAIFNESMRELGRANQDSKEDNIWRINQGLMRNIFYELTLFGDPEVSLKDPTLPEHDVAVKELNAPVYAVPNETFLVNVTVVNYGECNESNITVNFTVDGMTEGNITIGFLESGNETILSFNCTRPLGIYKLGIDINSFSGENITFNNVLRRAVIVGPDVAVTDLDIPYPPLYVNNTINLTATVKNLGNVNTTDVNLSLLIDGIVVNSTTISSLSSGNISDVTFGWIPNCSKWYDISCYIEPVSNENYTFLLNNYYNFTVHPVKVNDTLYVDDDGSTDFGTITDALYWIGEKGTIFVHNGIYTENIRIEKK